MQKSSGFWAASFHSSSSSASNWNISAETLRATGCRSNPSFLSLEKSKPFKKAAETSSEWMFHFFRAAVDITIRWLVLVAVGDEVSSVAWLASANPLPTNRSLTIRTPFFRLNVSTQRVGNGFRPVRAVYSFFLLGLPALFLTQAVSSLSLAVRTSGAREAISCSDMGRQSLSRGK